MTKNVRKKEHLYIEDLNVTDDIKQMLQRINKVASSDNQKIKQSIKDIFVISPACKELTKIAKCYERIIVTNGVYPVRGTKTYLELGFPASRRETDYKEFFASPRLAASTQNYFTGVFLISFEQWNNASELIRDVAFGELIKFVEGNKEHISFVFHVTPDFGDAEVLFSEISKHLNLIMIEHSNPDLVQAVEFVEKQLSEAGVELNKSGKKEMRTLIETKIDLSSSTYKGYRTLERLVSSLQFEICSGDVFHGICDEAPAIKIGGDDIKAISGNIEIPEDSKTNHRKMGFC